MTWSSYQLRWAAHARTQEFRRKVEQAKRIATCGCSEHNLFAGCSGGKDSVAVLGILEDVGIDVQVAHGTSSMAIPESQRVAQSSCDMLGFALDTVEPTEDPWAILATMQGSLFEAKNWTRFCFAAGEIQVLVWYRIQKSFDGVVMGLRADESRTRRWNAKKRGSVYHIQHGDSWAVCPLQWWSTDDVYAYIQKRALPLHPYYRRIYEVCSVPPEKSRISMAVPNEFVCSRGALMPLRALYPELWQRLVDAKAEIGTLG